MTGMSVLRHVYSLMEQPGRLTTAEGTESGLLALNQIYSNLWRREHSGEFEPLEHLRQEVQLSWRCLPAMTYGVAALLCLNGGEEKPYDRYLELYMRALPQVTGQSYRRSDVLFGEEVV